LFCPLAAPESLPQAFAKTAMIAKPFSHQQLVEAALLVAQNKLFSD
jgi:hypothetical protein